MKRLNNCILNEENLGFEDESYKFYVQTGSKRGGALKFIESGI